MFELRVDDVLIAVHADGELLRAHASSYSEEWDHEAGGPKAGAIGLHYDPARVVVTEKRPIEAHRNGALVRTFDTMTEAEEWRAAQVDEAAKSPALQRAYWAAAKPGEEPAATVRRIVSAWYTLHDPEAERLLEEQLRGEAAAEAAALDELGPPAHEGT